MRKYLSEMLHKKRGEKYKHYTLWDRGIHFKRAKPISQINREKQYDTSYSCSVLRNLCIRKQKHKPCCDLQRKAEGGRRLLLSVRTEKERRGLVVC